MALNLGQISVGTAVTAVLTVPPGTTSVLWYNLNTANTIYLGLSTAVTSSNGLAVHSVPTSFQGAPTSKGATIYGFSTPATTTLNFVISSGQ